jgi:hypothetical protein
MNTATDLLEIHGVPANIASWSAAGIPGFVSAVLDRWRRNSGKLPTRFAMVLCPQTEIDDMGGLPARVIELTSPRLRFQHFTGCHRPYVILFHSAGDAEAWRREIQGLLSWSESYQADLGDGVVRLQFVDAVEERDA